MSSPAKLPILDGGAERIFEDLFSLTEGQNYESLRVKKETSAGCSSWENNPSVASQNKYNIIPRGYCCKMENTTRTKSTKRRYSKVTVIRWKIPQEPKLQVGRLTVLLKCRLFPFRLTMTSMQGWSLSE